MEFVMNDLMPVAIVIGLAGIALYIVLTSKMNGGDDD
jgi:hypothetical protein